jgi:hypothetical protein
LDYFQARYYSSALGRFTGADDFLNDTHPASPASWNLYAYARNNPLKYIDPNGEEVRSGNLTTDQQQQILDDWKKKTGFQDIAFEQGKLVIKNRDKFEANGTSKTARKNLLGAIDSLKSFTLRAVDDVAEKDSITFARTRQDFTKKQSFIIDIDFDDFKARRTSDQAVADASSIGMIMFHELGHNSGKNHLPDLPNSGSDPGPNERKHMYPIYKELGLPKRQNYEPKKEGDMRYVYYKAKDGTKKVLSWQRSTVGGK